MWEMEAGSLMKNPPSLWISGEGGGGERNSEVKYNEHRNTFIYASGY